MTFARSASLVGTPGLVYFCASAVEIDESLHDEHNKHISSVQTNLSSVVCRIYIDPGLFDCNQIVGAVETNRATCGHLWPPKSSLTARR